MFFRRKLHRDCCGSSRFGSRGGAVCPPLEIGCHVTPLEVASGQPGDDVSVAASGTDRAWQIGMNLVEAVVRASSGGDASFTSMEWPATMAQYVWIVEGSAGGGRGTEVRRGHLWR